VPVRKTIFAMHKRTSAKSGGRQPAVGVEYGNFNGVRFRRERRSSARRGSTNALVTPIPHTFADTRRVQRQERRASARRGCEYRNCNGVRFRRERCSSARRGYRNSFAQTQARLFGELPAAYVQVAVALAFLVSTGGLRPPLLSCECGRLPVRKNNFLRCTNAHQQRAVFVRPPWFNKRALQTPIPHTFADTRRVQRTERRASARRGCEYGNCNGVRFR
jgi:hypothetical protein